VRSGLSGLLSLLALVVALCGQASASIAEERELAERYAPVVRLVAQPEACGPGEPYRPLDIDDVMDDPTVALRGPWNDDGDLVDIAPSAERLDDGLYEYHLDFPGDPLDPGCTYEEWSRRISEGSVPTVYAHVATDPEHPGKLALQYWLFYAFNDWNNLHEGDWEMIQLVFDADDAGQALERDPVEVGYSQHEGAEKAAWGDEKLEVVDGTHPVVHPAEGSHANFYDSAVYLGRAADQGVGCDDTSGDHVDLRPAVVTIPSDPAAARAQFPWIAYEGHWGERQPAFFNGPTGPNLKDQWTAPIQWSEDWRDRSYAVPGTSLLGTSATDLFCAAIAQGSDLLRRATADPVPTITVVLLVLALIVWGLTRATWTPSAPLRVARRRSWGQVLSAAWRMYGRRPLLFLSIGVVFLPVVVVTALIQAGLASAASIAGVDNQGAVAGAVVLVLLVLGLVFTILATTVVQAATIRALTEIDAGRPAGPIGAYRAALRRVGPLLRAIVVASVAVALLSLSVFLIPVAVWLGVRWSLGVAVIQLEDAGGLPALRRSARLVRGRWLKVGSLTLIATAITIIVGPLVGVGLILATSLPFWVANVVSGIVYGVAIPFVGLTTAYVYADARVQGEIERSRDPEELPAEA
jgi:hypothetical protein